MYLPEKAGKTCYNLLFITLIPFLLATVWLVLALFEWVPPPPGVEIPELIVAEEEPTFDEYHFVDWQQ